ncbi:MAG: hypothetical protein Q8L65_04045 [Burkholderiales bacterium]|nr:hypothetical protein [Burkholderiales bacterium]
MFSWTVSVLRERQSLWSKSCATQARGRRQLRNSRVGTMVVPVVCARAITVRAR